MAAVTKIAKLLFAKNLSGVKNELAEIQDIATKANPTRDEISALNLRKQIALSAADIIKTELDAKANADLVKRLAALELANSKNAAGSATFNDGDVDELEFDYPQEPSSETH